MEQQKIRNFRNGRPKSRRSRCKGRQSQTFQNKLTKLQSTYKKRVKASLKSKNIFLALSEEAQSKILKSKRQTCESQIKKEPKQFFYAKYPKFEDFAEVNVLKEIGRTEEKRVVKKPAPRTVAGWMKK